MTAPELVLSHVSKRLGGRVVLDDVNLSVSRGELVALVGPNGAGKSTLISVAGGLMLPDAGEVSLFGAGYREGRASILRRIGVVFQSRSLDLEMSVRAGLGFHAALMGYRGAEAAACVEAVAWRLDIAGLLDQRVATLSGGSLRRVEIARALLHQPELLLCDEASAGLDPDIRAELIDHVRRLCSDTGMAVLWTTHLLDELPFADRIIHLAAGQALEEPEFSVAGAFQRASR